MPRAHDDTVDTLDPDDAVGQRTPRTRNRRGQGAELRNELIAAASRLLEDLGGEAALTLRAVAREAGVAAPSIYLHFAELHQLVDAVLESRFGELRELINDAANGSATPADELRARARAYCQFAADHPGNYRVMFTAVPIAPRACAIEDLPGARIVLELAACIGRCAQSGATPPFDALTSATLLWTTLHGIVSLRVSKPAFPWAPTDELVDRALLALCAIPLP
jgi:AcrR family transcriptional regulator